MFSPSHFEAHPLLRGVYFVSGTQEGTPIDRMLGVLARSYQLERAVLPPNYATGKSFFLERLLREVIFGESELGGTDLKWERRRGRLALAGYVALGLVAVVLLGVWGRSYVANRQYVDEVATRVADVRRLVQATPNRALPDLLVLLPALRATRDLATGGGPVPWSQGAGLYQGDRLDAAASRSCRAPSTPNGNRMYWTAEMRSSSSCLASKRAGIDAAPGSSPSTSETCSSIPIRRSSSGRISRTSVISMNSVAESSFSPGISSL